ncbi:MAG: AAA family ATPase [Rubrobacter sp.]
MNEQKNPFLYGRPLESTERLVGRDVELEELLGSVRSGQAVMVYGPRRYGKTSLARVVEGRAQEKCGIPGIYVDLWGASSVSDVVGVLGQAYARASGAFRMRRLLADLLGRLGFTVSFEGTSVGVSYEGAQRERREREALMELLRVPQRMSSRTPSGRVLMILDEFGEVLSIPGEPDALLRSAFQDSPNVSFLFMGSKKSLMDGLFSDRRRPFYNFGRRLELGRLSYEGLGEFVEERFEGAGKSITAEAVDVLLGLGQGHPYRTQQLAFHAFRLSGKKITDEETVFAAKDATLDEAEPEFRAILDTMERPRRAMLVALCKEPTSELYSRPYIQRHGIRGSGSLKSSLDSLLASGDLEPTVGGPPRPTDPLLALWVRERMNG